MSQITVGALLMTVVGFIVLFGGLAVTLWIALQSGGYGDSEDAATSAGTTGDADATSAEATGDADTTAGGEDDE